MLYAIASLVTFDDPPANHAAWVKIQRVFGQAGLTLTGLPHFSWHVAAAYDLAGVDAALEVYSRSISPFALRVAGIGVFSGEAPVIYLPVTRSPQLAAVHSQLFQLADASASQSNSYYTPETWIPHITLMSEDFTADAVCQVVSELAYIPLTLELVVDHFVTIYRDDTTSGVRSRHHFGGGMV